MKAKVLEFWNKWFVDKNKSKKKKGFLREWLDAIIFAGGFALIIRTFIVEAFLIPTSSMERSLMVGDFLFVSKFSYGLRVPMVPLCIPFIHNKLPFSHTRSFLDWIQIPYFRFPAFSDIQRNDVVVFNYPADDIQPNDPQLGPVLVPSMKENYIKRCVAVPGDKLEIRDGQIFINGKMGYNPPEMQRKYCVFTQNNQPVSYTDLLKENGFRAEGDPNANWDWISSNPSYAYFFMTNSLASKFQKYPWVERMERCPVAPDPGIFPNRNGKLKYNWSLDDFGPVLLPKKGAAIALDTSNIDMYRRVIEVYEKHKLRVEDEKIFIDDKQVTSYTPEMDYYFMMGDNRYNSLDSRYWGFVPEDHIVGKPWMVFFSKEGGFSGIRWERCFKSID